MSINFDYTLHEQLSTAHKLTALHLSSATKQLRDETLSRAVFLNPCQAAEP